MHRCTLVSDRLLSDLGSQVFYVYHRVVIIYMELEERIASILVYSL